MNDPNLCARLDALEFDLNACLSPTTWKDLDLPFVWKDDNVWKRIDAPIREEIVPLLDELEEVRKDYNALKQDDNEHVEKCEQVWLKYGSVYNDSQQIFRECLELIGGLVLRDKLLDDGICQVADDLIVRSSIEVGTNAPVTVPSSQEALRKTLSRIIRFRFPEWTYWTLPFTAHEYGHVVVDENLHLRRFVKKEIKAHVAAVEKVEGKLSSTMAKRVRKRKEIHVEELLADAFATYTMGPAYACATLMHRFNIYSAFEEDDEHPSEARRAHVVLSMLEHLNKKSGLNDYKRILEYLHQEWARVLAMQPDPKAGLTKDDITYLNYLIQNALKIFFIKFKEARYGIRRQKEGWDIARAWARDWMVNLKLEEPLTVHKVTRDHRVRDVLNAAWYCRIQYHEQMAGLENELEIALKTKLMKRRLKDIIEVTEEMCDEIVELRSGATRKIREQKQLRNLQALKKLEMDRMVADGW